MPVGKRERFGPVQVTRLSGRREWTPEQAVSLLEQGYTVEQVVSRTGFDRRWVSAQLRRLAPH